MTHKTKARKEEMDNYNIKIEKKFFCDVKRLNKKLKGK